MSIYLRNVLFSPAGEGGSGGGAGGSGAGASGSEGAGGGQSGSGANAGGNGGAGAGTGGSSGGTGSGGVKDSLFGDDKGGAGGSGGSGDGKGGQGGGAGGNDPNKPAGGGGNEVVIPANWKDVLPPELKDEPFMKLVNDVPTLVKNYANAQKMIGADKIPIPSKHATEQEWREVSHKLGLPRELAEYNFEVDKETEPLVDKEFVSKFKEFAFKQGVMPKQAQAMVKFFGELNRDSWRELETQSETKLQEGWRNLDREWGTTKEAKTVAAKAAITEFADQETANMLRDMGLGKNPKFMKFMSKIGETLSEDKLRAADQGGGSFHGGLTPQQATEKIAEVNTNMKHPYWNKEHENHGQAKKDMAMWYKAMAPDKKSS